MFYKNLKLLRLTFRDRTEGGMDVVACREYCTNKVVISPGEGREAQKEFCVPLLVDSSLEAFPNLWSANTYESTVKPTSFAGSST